MRRPVDSPNSFRPRPLDAAALPGFRPAGSNAERTRAHNRRLVLGQVRAAGTRGRAEIARGAGLSTQAVSNIIAELHAEGLLCEAGRRVIGRGLPAMQYALNPCGGFAIGAEVRPDALLVTVLDLAGQTRFSAREPLADNAPGVVADRLAALADRARRDAGIEIERLMGAGVVMPGPFGPTGLAGAPSDLVGWHGVEPSRLLGEALGLETLVENDANAAALGERVAGVAQQLDDYAFVYFGAGLGLGIVHEGRLLRGAFGNAGEIGHVGIAHAGAVQPLERVASRLALVTRLRACGLQIGTADEIAVLHRERHPSILSWLADAAPALGHAVELLENLFDPQVVVFGGALPDALLDELVATLPLSRRSVACRADRVLPRVLRGASGRLTAAVGGAALVINRAFTPQLAAFQ